MKRSGFTLIELSIVLIIIGLIIGAVMKGKDLINSADQKKIYNTWVNQWQVTFNTYQDRTGGVLGDGIINGGTATDPNGQCDNVRLDTTTSVQNKLKAIGLDIPVSNIATSNGGAYKIKGKYTTSTATAYLYWLYSHTDGTYKNRLYITGMPTDVAIAFDTMTDGAINPSAGSFRRYADTSTGTDGTSNTWPDASVTKTVNVSLEL
ncbi:prepilin-type N-terminal cleavage/methylation domain-containing protein [Sulfurimonas autotrophica]|uniref:Putative type II secretion system protein n=1 Tax=Sulfurimonas autotrophica (strain ATCC BAA-671 / DSM 16294 / JCM 11897 / OK10) TaxID=563040 RepID=E0UP42_SULAO|nr:prepilin-type N-terminal cleavage/methylation domain-containing protein [Sulfurimonas autotrophica]ADN08075.1 putative type II secretion system protein [Sulfurimonas autotrophica DSM 16294]